MNLVVGGLLSGSTILGGLDFGGSVVFAIGYFQAVEVVSLTTADAWALQNAVEVLQ